MSTNRNVPFDLSRQKASDVLLESMVAGSSSAMLDANQARGQSTLRASSTLPVMIGEGGEAETVLAFLVLEKAGVKFLDFVDDSGLFRFVELPAGWHMAPMPSNPEFWTNLVDENGRPRAAIFFKNDFPVSHAYMHLTTRFSIENDFDHQAEENAAIVNVLDGNKTIFTSKYPWPESLRGKSSLTPGAEADAYVDANEQAKRDARKWLREHYPDWESPVAYWNLLANK